MTVPIPDRGDQVLQALAEGLLLRQEDPDQLRLDLDLTASRDHLHREWESAADRESRALTKYAQSGIKLEEVAREAASARGALGSRADVADFVRQALAGLGAPVRAADGALAARTFTLPPGVRHGLGLGAPDRDQEIVFRPDLPVGPGEHALARTDLVVRGLARYVVDAALDPLLAGTAPSPARRCGVIRTGAVATRTTLLLARYRFQLTLPGRFQSRTVVAEEAQLLAYRGSGEGREWLSEDEVDRLLGARPQNVLPELVRSAIDRAVGELAILPPDLDVIGQELADRLHEAHRRVRTAAGAARRGLQVRSCGGADVLGVYVYLPVGGSG